MLMLTPMVANRCERHACRAATLWRAALEPAPGALWRRRFGMDQMMYGGQGGPQGGPDPNMYYAQMAGASQGHGMPMMGMVRRRLRRPRRSPRDGRTPSNEAGVGING